MRVGKNPLYKARAPPSSFKIVVAAWMIPVYLCSPVIWKAKRARIVSSGYVSVTAVNPAPAPAKNLSACLMKGVGPKYFKQY